MSATAQEVRTDIVWNTEGVDKGEQRILAATSRLDKAEDQLAKASAARDQANEARRRAVQARLTDELIASTKRRVQQERQLEEQGHAALLSATRGMHASLEKYEREHATRMEQEHGRLVNATRGMHASLEKHEHEHAARIQQVTKQKYASMDKSSEFRQAALVSSLRVTNDGGPASRGGRSGGHGGGDTARYIGDALDSVTGSQGWVMRANMIKHLGAAGAAFAGLGLAERAVGGMVERVKQGGERNERGNEEFTTNVRSTMFDNSARGSEALSERARRFHELGEAEIATQREAERTRNLISMTARGVGGTVGAMSLTGPLGIGAGAWLGGKAAGGLEAIGKRFGIMPTGEQLTASKLRQAANYAGERRERALRGEALGEDAALSGERTHGSRFTAREMEIAIAAKGDETKAREGGFTPAERAAQRSVREHERGENDAARGEFMAGTGSQRRMADFRGNAEERTLTGAKEALKLEQERLAIAQHTTAEAKVEAEVRVSQARLNLELTKQQLAEQRIARGAAVRTAGVGLSASRFASEQDQFSPDETKRFAAGQAISRREALSGVQAADIALEAAKARVAEEKKTGNGKAGADALNGVTMATAARDAAGIAQQVTEKRLTTEASERERSRGRELAASRNETGAMGMANRGRGDMAALDQSRFAAQQQADELRHIGKPEMAAEVEAQQRLREQAMVQGQLLTPDGRTRRASANREARERRQTEGRFRRAQERLARNGGLINVRRDIHGDVIEGIDPITREGRGIDRGARAIEKQFPRKDPQAEAAGLLKDIKNALGALGDLGDVKRLLDTRLPSITQK